MVSSIYFLWSPTPEELSAQTKQLQAQLRTSSLRRTAKLKDRNAPNTKVRPIVAGFVHLVAVHRFSLLDSILCRT